MVKVLPGIWSWLVGALAVQDSGSYTEPASEGQLVRYFSGRTVLRTVTGNLFGMDIVRMVHMIRIRCADRYTIEPCNALERRIFSPYTLIFSPK